MMWTYHFSKKKKKWPLICGNGNAEIEGKKNCGNEFVAMALPKQEGKFFFVAIGLWQWHCRNRWKRGKNCLMFGNGIAEIGNWKREKERAI